MAQNDDVFDARDAADYLRINEQTIRRLARDQEIPAFKVGGSWRFKKSSLDRWAGSQEMRPRPETRWILVVDDEEAVRTVLRRTLEREGFRVTVAAGGAEVLPIIGGERPDLVFLDLKMPDMDGPAVLKEVRGGWGDVPVIVLTGFPDSDLMERALQHSPITLLSKPSTPSLIINTVNGILGTA